MNIRATGKLPASLEAVRRRFEKWRRTRQPGARISKSLWAAAVKMAGIYGLHRTARALPVEYYSLKKRVELAAATQVRFEPDSGTAFVELPPSMPIESCGFTLELEDADGSKMRVDLKAATPPDLVALCRSFWNPGP